MPDRDELQFDDSQLQAPPRLAADLVRLSEGAPSVPAALDAELASLARAHFARVAKRRSAIRWLSASAAAAALLLVALLWFTRAGAATPFDVNGDGRIDILDAYALATKLEQRVSLSARFDVNHDGVVDYRDVDAIAMEAVRLDRRRAR